MTCRQRTFLRDTPPSPARKRRPCAASTAPNPSRRRLLLNKKKKLKLFCGVVGLCLWLLVKQHCGELERDTKRVWWEDENGDGFWKSQELVHHSKRTQREERASYNEWRGTFTSQRNELRTCLLEEHAFFFP